MASNGGGGPPPDPPQRPLRKYMKGLGSTAIIIGILSVILSSVLVSQNGIFVTDYAGSGVWCGLFFIAQGCCALSTFSTAIAYMGVATIVTSVASTILAITLLGVLATSITIQSKEDVYTGLKAAEGLMILLGVAEIALSGCCIVVGFLFMRQNRQESPTNAQNPDANEQIGPEPFLTMAHQKTVKWMGLWEAAVGLFSLIDNSITVWQNVHIEDIGVGIWCGVIFLATGILTFFAAASRSKKQIIATLVMSICCPLFAIIMMVWPALFMPRVGHCYNFCKQYSEIATAYGLLIVLSLAELIMSLWCAVVCWKAVCRPECFTCCVPQVVLHIQEADRDPQATQGVPRLVPVTGTARDYTIGSQIHVQICLTTGHVQTGNDQPRYQGASNFPS